MAIKIIGLNSFFRNFLKESVKDNIPKRKFVWLIGAGMSASAGIPVAQGVSDRIVLLEYMEAQGLSKPWLSGNGEFTELDETDFFDDIGDLSEGLYSIENLIEYFQWYTENEDSENHNRLLDDAYIWLAEKEEFSTVSRGNPECYQLLFDKFILSKDTSTDFLSALIRLSSSVNLAHLSLAGILRDFPEWGDTVYTTNFDDLLLKALLQLNKSARVFGEYESTVKPSANPNYPQIVHLHGKYTGYGIKNTKTEISYIKPVFQESFRSHIGDANLIVVGYSGWDDLVMKTLQEWKNNSELIRGAIYWVPYLGVHTMEPEVLSFLNELPYSNQINIIVRDDLLDNPDTTQGLDADYFMIKMCNFINRGKQGFLPYRQEIVSNASKQHKFILKELQNYPEFSPERVFNIIDEAEEHFRSNKQAEFNLTVRKALKIVNAKDLPNLIRAKGYFSLGALFYNLDNFEEAVRYFLLAESFARLEDKVLLEARSVRIQSFNKLAASYLHLNNFKEALECINKSYIRASDIAAEYPELLAEVNYLYIYYKLLSGSPIEKPLNDARVHLASFEGANTFVFKLNLIEAIFNMARNDYSKSLQILGENDQLLKEENGLDSRAVFNNTVAKMRCYVSTKNLESFEVEKETVLGVYSSANKVMQSNFHECLAWYAYAIGDLDSFWLEIEKAYTLAEEATSYFNMSDICLDVVNISKKPEGSEENKKWHERLVCIPLENRSIRVISELGQFKELKTYSNED
jgi:tetratricopeptide (TPR) repeat protein